MVRDISRAVFSDGARPWVLLVSVAWLGWCGWRYQEMAASRHSSYAWCEAHREDCRGRTIRFALWKVVAVRPDGYSIFKVRGPVPVSGDPAGLEVGDTVSVEGVFQPDGAVVRERHRAVHRLRPLKKAFSVLGGALAAALAARRLRVAPGGLVERG